MLCNKKLIEKLASPQKRSEKQGNKKLKRRGRGIRQKLANDSLHTWIQIEKSSIFQLTGGVEGKGGGEGGGGERRRGEGRPRREREGLDGEER